MAQRIGTGGDGLKKQHPWIWKVYLIKKKTQTGNNPPNWAKQKKAKKRKKQSAKNELPSPPFH